MHGGAEHEHLRVAFLQREPERGRTAEREEVVGTCAKPEGGKGFRKEGVDSRVKCGQEASREEGAGGGELWERGWCPWPEPCQGPSWQSLPPEA